MLPFFKKIYEGLRDNLVAIVVSTIGAGLLLASQWLFDYAMTHRLVAMANDPDSQLTAALQKLTSAHPKFLSAVDALLATRLREATKVNDSVVYDALSEFA